MANPKIPDPEHVQYAHDEMAKGRSSREVAAELATLGVPVSHMTVARWAKQWPAQQARAAEPGPMVAPAPRPNALAADLAARKAATPPPPVINASDTLGTLRGMLEGFLLEAHRSKEGNPRLAATLGKAASDILDQIRKIEARQAEDQSQMRVSREEIAKAHAAMLERAKALCARPLLCADCGRKLAIAWGDAGAKVEEAKKGEGA